MPAPLFQYVWQYNNQPIEQLAQDIVNVIAQSGNGPVNTANYIPVSNGLTFQDSPLVSFSDTLLCEISGQGFNLNTTQFQFGILSGYAHEAKIVFDKTQSGRIQTRDENDWRGLDLDLTNKTYTIGETGSGSNGTNVQIIDSGGIVALVTALGAQATLGIAPGTIIADSVSSNTAGSTAGKYIKIKVDGVDYKLELLNV